MKKLLLYTAVLFISAMGSISLTGCQKENIKLTTSEEVSILGYLQQDPDKFSDVIRILDRTNISGFLNAYGAYTFFAPTNSAIQDYLKETGQSSVDLIDTTELKDLIRYHLIEDTITTQSFTDGKMPKVTMYGQYLLTNAINIDGATKPLINKRARITESNVKVTNGMVHVIDKVLLPAKKSLTRMIEEDGKYTIFVQALKATGYYDTLNNTGSGKQIPWKTVVAQSDSVYKALGFADYTALRTRYSNTGNPMSKTDSLNLYVAYHIIPDIKFLADIITAPSHSTLAPLEVLTSKLKIEEILFNEDVFNGILEPGVKVERGYSDVTASNGVLHAVTGNLYIKIRRPSPIYFDVADQPELKKMTNIFRIPGKFVDVNLGQLAGVTWQQGQMRYSSAAATTADFNYYDDIMEFALRVNPVVNNWVEFTTPMIVKGKYKIWLCFRRNNHGTFSQVSFDGEVLPKIVSFTDFAPSTGTETELEALGVKKYSNAPASNTNQQGRLAGVIEVKTTDRHRIRIQAIRDAGSGAGPQASASSGRVQLDMIHIIPVNDDQIFPKFHRNGTLIPR